MSDAPTSADWAKARGEKWRDQLEALEAMLAPVDAPLIEALRLDAPYRIADMACGGGGTTLAIGRSAPQGSAVHGYDISSALVEVARSRTPWNDALTFAVADGAAARPDAPYDRLASRFGIMFFDDPPGAFANLARWLAPHGRFAFAVWGPPKANPWMASLRAVASEIVDLEPPDPEAPGPFRYAGGEALGALLEEAGFREIAVHDWRGELALGGGMAPAEAAAFALAAFSLGDLLAEEGPEVLDAVREGLAAHYAEHQTGGAVTMAAHVHIVTGVGPEGS